jgi:hypothetical protein
LFPACQLNAGCLINFGGNRLTFRGLVLTHKTCEFHQNVPVWITDWWDERIARRSICLNHGLMGWKDYTEEYLSEPRMNRIKRLHGGIFVWITDWKDGRIARNNRLTCYLLHEKNQCNLIIRGNQWFRWMAWKEK